MPPPFPESARLFNRDTRTYPDKLARRYIFDVAEKWKSRMSVQLEADCHIADFVQNIRENVISQVVPNFGQIPSRCPIWIS